MLRQLYIEASDTLHPVMVRGVVGMAIFHLLRHGDTTTRPATPDAVRRHSLIGMPAARLRYSPTRRSTTARHLPALSW